MEIKTLVKKLLLIRYRIKLLELRLEFVLIMLPGFSRMKDDMQEKESSILLIFYLAFLFGYIFNKGYYTFGGAVLLLIILISFFIYFFRKDKLKLENLPSSAFLKRSILVLSLFLSLFYYGGLHQQKGPLFLFSQFILIICLLMGIFLKNISKYFWYFLLLYLFLGIIMILTSPFPLLDVYYIQKRGVQDFLNGINPYSQLYAIVYENVSDTYPYLPGMLFLSSPFVFLLKDHRFALLFAQIVSTLIIAYKWKNPQVALIYLFNPLSLFILELSFTEPLIFLLIMSVVSLAWNRKFILTSLVFGFFLATKQYGVLFLPMFFHLVKRRIIYLLLALLIGACMVLPFALLDFKGLYYGMVHILMSFPFREDGLTFTAILKNEFGITLPSFFLPIVCVISFSVIFFNRIVFSYRSILIRIFLLLFVFFFFNKFAFVNYYYLLSSLLLLAIVVGEREIKANS